MEGGKTLNKQNDLIKKAWLNLYICITTDDVKEFYKALGGNVLRNCKNHYTWNEVNNVEQIKEKAGRPKKNKSFAI